MRENSHNSRKDVDTRKALEPSQSCHSQQTDEISAAVCTQLTDDISDRYEISPEPEQAFVQMKTLTNLAPVGILQLALDCSCQYANDMWYELSDLTSEESHGGNWINAIHTDDVHDTLNDLRESVCTNAVFKKELRLQKPLGGITWVNMSATSTIDEQHKLTGFLVVFTDNTEKHHAAERLRQFAHHDTLTGLLNRQYFLDTLTENLSGVESREKIGLLSIDLDGFKAVNDSFGHDAGDAVLREAANRLRNSVQKTDVVARLGGDEFTVTLTGLNDEDQAASIAQKIIEDINRPISVAGVEVEISASIGISTCEVDQVSCDELIKQADVALFQAKQTGRSQAVFFSQELIDEQQRHAELIRVVRHAVENSQLSLAYQPQIDLRSHQIMGFEALLRIPQAFGTEKMPSEVIKVLEDTGMIAEVGAWALKTACNDYMSWLSDGLINSDCKLSVNVSARQLSLPSLLSSIEIALESSFIPPSSLVVELTESAFIDHTEKTLDAIRAIKRLGIGVSLDDFGTGFSSLSYLSRLPIDHLKIDRSFVTEICNSERRLAIVKAIIGMAKALDITVIAEGVESREIVMTLAREGCDAYQGYYFSKPKTFQDIVKLLTNMTPVELMRVAALYELGDETVSANINKDTASIEFSAAN